MYQLLESTVSLSLQSIEANLCCVENTSSYILQYFWNTRKCNLNFLRT